jgi:hypothetical protein
MPEISSGMGDKLYSDMLRMLNFAVMNGVVISYTAVRK